VLEEERIMTTAAAATGHRATERYQILRQIGGGGMGVVYEAIDSHARRPVALKFVRDGTNKTTACRQLAREAAAMALPQDRRVCSVYGLATCAGKTCMVMERLVGQTLASRIAAGPLSTPELLEIAIQLLMALEAVHRVGLVHQDIKPANIFLTATNAVKVLDFGLAVGIGEPVAGSEHSVRKPGGGVLGTPNYVAPERLSEGPADPRSDLFSLGVVIYEMATGRPPFSARTTQDVILNVLAADPVPLRILAPERPPALEGLVRKLLARNVDERYDSAVRVRKALQRIRVRLCTACHDRAVFPCRSTMAPPIAEPATNRLSLCWSAHRESVQTGSVTRRQ
jgi:serine/threonine protein kinase